MATTIRINEDVKEQLKLKSVATGVSQFNLANKYIIEGIKNDNTPNKPVKTIEEIERILDYDKKEDNTHNHYDTSYDIPDDLKLNEKHESNTPIYNMEDIKKILENDKPEGDTILKELDGIVHFDKVTNSVELKKESYDRS